MAPSPHKFREAVFQLLYSQGFEGCDDDGLIPMVMKQLTVPKKVAREAQRRACAIVEGAKTFDEKIASRSTNTPLDWVHRIERAILHLAFFELEEGKTPEKVVYAEAVRLAKKYATKEGAGYVNAILDAKECLTS